MNVRQSISLPENPRSIVVIGAGGIVLDAHLPAYSQAGWKVLGIFDIDAAKAKEARKRYPIIEEVFGSLESLVRACTAQDVVFDLALPADQVIPVLEKLPEGSAVLMQKPLGETLHQSREILALCERKRLTAAVNLQLKFAPHMLAAQDMISRGLLGQVYDLEVKVCVLTPWDRWNFLKEKPRMEVLYHTIHYLDLIRAIMGDPSRVIGSLARNPKTPSLADARSSIILDYDQFSQARIITNHGHDYGMDHQDSYLKIEGMQGAVKVTIGVSLDYPKGRASKLEFCRRGRTEVWETIPVEGDWFPEAFIGSMALLQNHLNNPEIPLDHGVRDAFHTMELVEKVYESSLNL